MPPTPIEIGAFAFLWLLASTAIFLAVATRGGAI